MKRAFVILLLLLVSACGRHEPNLVVKGHIKGLKKGTIYLQKMQDTVVVTLDSLAVIGEEPFELQGDLEEPEVLFLTLDNNTENEHRITFFADKGITEINTSLKRYAFDAVVKGSVQQEKFDEYNEILKKFNANRLDLFKEEFEAQKSEDDSLILAVQQSTDNLIKRKYLYTVNFALNNRDSEVAPYVALAEIFDANIKYLDTIYNALDENIADSKYGKELATFIAERKLQEEQ